MPLPELSEFLAVLQMSQQPGGLRRVAGEFHQDSGQCIHPQSFAGQGFVHRPPHHDGRVDAEGGLETMVRGTGAAGGTHGLGVTDSRGRARCFWEHGFCDLRFQCDGQGHWCRLRADPAQEGSEQIPETLRGDADPEPSAQPASLQGLDSSEVVETMVDVFGVPGVGEADDDLHVMIEYRIVRPAQKVGRQPRMGWEALPEYGGRELRRAAPVDGAERLAEVLVQGNVSRHEAQETGAVTAAGPDRAVCA